jgi:hypothetical protein
VPAIGLLWTLPPVARGTLVKGTPVVIETSGRAGFRAFSIAYASNSQAQVRDRGPAVLTITLQKAGLGRTKQLRRISATEVLRGEQGILTLSWSGAQSQRQGTWGRVVGTWSITSGRGAYAAVKGGGRFASDRTLRAAHYTGFLITAV